MASSNEGVTNEKWIFHTRPSAEEVTAEHYRKTTESLTAGPGEVLLETLFCSVDPYMRIQQAASKTWEDPHPTGQVQGSGTVLRVVHSNVEGVTPGQIFLGYTGWQKYVVLSEEQIKGCRDLAPLKEHGLPLSYALGILGMPARTAYFGLLEAGKVQAGETLVVSGAAGAVGCIVVQIAKLKGMRVVAIAGSAEKLVWLQGELGADAVIDYTQHDSQEAMHQALQAACPDGVDVYWDNVGGYITDAVLELINVRARVIICGQITQYNGGLDAPAPGPRFLHRLIYTRATIQGILARDYNHRMPEMLAQITEWLTSGQIKYKETVWEGFDRLPDALNALFHSKNTGKMIVKVAE